MLNQTSKQKRSRDLSSSLKLDSNQSIEVKKRKKEEQELGWKDLKEDAYEKTINLDKRRNTPLNQETRPTEESQVASQTTVQFKSYPDQYKSNLDKHFPTQKVDELL